MSGGTSRAARRARTHARTHLRSEGKRRVAGAPVYAEKGGRRRCPFRRGRRVGWGVCEESPTVAAEDGATAPTLGQNAAGRRARETLSFGAAPGRDA